MKAIVHEIPAVWLEERRKKGQDLHDEMWDGVLHVNPTPGFPHQDFKEALLELLRGMLADSEAPGHWYGERNIAKPKGWPDDFRVPDLLFVGPRCRGRVLKSHLEGPPDVVVEIAGEGDESREKLPWYAELGVTEVWIIDLEARRPEILVLSGGGYMKKRPGPEGWLRSVALPVEIRSGRMGRRKALELRVPGEKKPRACL